MKGFTLVELLVCAAIISVIAGGVLVGFRVGNRNWALARSAQNVSQDIRRASNMALSSPTYTCPGSGKVYGYGVCFASGGPGAGYCANDSAASKTTYILFADCNGDNDYDGTSVDVKIEAVSVESGIQVKELSPITSFSVVFVPPDPTTKFCPDCTIGCSSPPTSGTVTLSFISNPNTTKTISINNKGNIDVQ